jgi:hypothetical protein
MNNKITFSLFIIGCMFTILGHAQQKRIMLFNNYTNGTVLMINKARTEVPLNYDAANYHMMYLQDKKEMILTNNNDVDTIFINSRKFIPAGPLYLEVVSLSNGKIYINWQLKKTERGKAGAYGQATQSSIQVINTNRVNSGGVYENQYTEIYELSNNNEYWLLYNGKYIKCKNMKDVLKRFSQKTDSIKSYIKEHHIDFNSIKDALTLLNYCLSN